MPENTDQEYSEYRRFLRSDYHLLHFTLQTKKINLKSGISIMNNVTLLLQVLNTGEHMSEATSGAFLWKNMFWKVSQYSHEKICGGDSF